MVERSISENNNLPILKHVLLKTINNKVRLSTTNLELAATTYIQGKIVEDGSIALPFPTFNSIISNTNSERIELESSNNNLVIKLDNYEAKIQGLSENDFPIIPKIENSDEYIQIDSGLLRDSLNKVVIAAQISEIKPELSGVLLNFSVNYLKLAATDSFRLSEKTINSSQIKSNFEKPFKVIIPLQTIEESIRIFNSDSIVTINKDSNQIFLKNDSSEIISRIIDGSYPDYEQIIPRESETEILIKRDDLIQSLKLVSNFSGKINDVHLKIKGENALEVYASNQFIGENSYLISIKIKGKPFSDVTFNWRYLLDGLKSIDGEKINFFLNGENRAAILKPMDDNSFLYIVMPIKSN